MSETETGSAVDLLQRISVNGTRHHSITQVARHFAYNHLRADLAVVSRVFAEAMVATVLQLSDGPELTKALNALLEAKDWAVRQALVDAGLIQ